MTMRFIFFLVKVRGRMRWRPPLRPKFCSAGGHPAGLRPAPQAAGTMGGYQVAVDVHEASGRLRPDPASESPAEGRKAHRIADERRLQKQRWEQVGGAGTPRDNRGEVALTGTTPAPGHRRAIAREQRTAWSHTAKTYA